MANKKANYTTTKNINKIQKLINMGTTNTQMSKLMNLSYNQVFYLRYLVNNKNQKEALNDSTVIAMVNKKPIVKRKARVSNVVKAKTATPKEVEVKRIGNNIRVTINLAI